MGAKRTGYEHMVSLALIRNAERQVARIELNIRTGQDWRYTEALAREARVMLTELRHRGEQLEFPMEY